MSDSTIESLEHDTLKRIVIVGGGTSGWLTANHLARVMQPRKNPQITILVIESPDIPTVGVGEGTVPAMRDTLRSFGISESTLIRECDVTFKQGIKFVNWVRSEKTSGFQFYHHAFDHPRAGESDILSHWLRGAFDEYRYAELVGIQDTLCELGKAPKTIAHREYEGYVNYAYHLNAGKFSALLAKHATEHFGVEHAFATVVDVALDKQGNIETLFTKEIGDISGDLFIDCSGFSARLIEGVFNEPFIDQSSVLFVDNAIVAQVPYHDIQCPLVSSTIATAQDAGWIWDIGLTNRKGVGYVYSSAHISHERAEHALRQYIGNGNEEVSTRRIPMKIGYRRRAWVKNCVAMGLAQGFVEPLEATGLLMFDVTARMLATMIPAENSRVPASAPRFNQVVTDAWERIIEFIKLHYCISKRRDSDFWIDNTEDKSIPSGLKEKLAQWRYRLPNAYDFTETTSVFNLDNYLYVLYGMEYETNRHSATHRIPSLESAQKELRDLVFERKKYINELPSHRDLINKIHLYGLSEF